MPHVITFHEGALPLLDGETLEGFREALVFALRETYEAAGRITRDAEGMRLGWVWVVDVFSDSVIVEVEQDGIPGSVCEMVRFTRGPNGDFMFADPVPVRRKVSWVPIADDGESYAGEAREVPDRERDLGSEITTETIGGVPFPVGDPNGVNDAFAKLDAKRRPPNTGYRWPPYSEQEIGQLQSVFDRTNKRHGTNLVLPPRMS